MTEHETNPQPRPANPGDAEPSQPTAEFPRVEREQSGSHAETTAQFGAVPGQPSGAATPGQPPAAPLGPDAPVGSTDPQPPVAHTAPQPPVGSTAPQPPVGPAPQPGAPVSASPWQSHQPPSHQPPSHQPYPGQPYPGQPYRPAGWGGYPAGAPHGTPGQPQPPYPGGDASQLPPWAQQVSPGAPRSGSGRVAKFVAAGAAALALMVGSGIAGGALALALNDEMTAPASDTRSAASAPVINRSSLAEIASKVQNSVVSISTGSGEGSGVILSTDGYVLTNNHVVESASGNTVSVVFANGKTASARIIGTDPKTDLAVIRVQGVSDLVPATFGDSSAMRVGDTVLALGSPLGLQGSVTAGIISAENRTIQAGGQQESPFSPGSARTSMSGLLQTDAPINPGNSGGALVNTKGEVIGINTAIATSGQGQGNIGVGFAIPSNKAKAVADALRKGEKVSHPFLGVSVTRGPNGGAVVSSVTPDSPADKAGLQKGDVITRFGDKPVNDSDGLVSAVQSGKVGDRVPVTYTRNGAERTATVTLAEAS
ncbi:putative serine protease PepD [Micromonospora pattaloongensis]|uniref:Putative serine protease PepD n=1 Tax=Micromonospora pattaloongensis TaxID=405436 RepID=A0A1H3G0A2_9ACTN|nr:trypsin-like peptidase domain-containing protein [Micromonospora pattaloongensis]SDX95854.1 putative serine protease PepD [Micromonospora pattaloongensis]